MPIRRNIARGMVAMLAATITVAAFDAAYATTKKPKHSKPAPTTTTQSTPQPSTPVGPPDPGVYK
jgi:hypothetical protein